MKELLAEVIQKRPDDVIKNERLGDSLTFGPIEPDIRHFHEFCTTFSTLSYGIIPEEQFGAINQMLSDAKDAYINIAEFSPAHATRRPGDEMRALAERFQPAADKFIGATIGYTTYLLYKDGHIQTQIG
ncbi:MAG TPA: hypothetical protein VLM37_09085, partial [Fibrobacteraceae bacterium]|nr:hypothetical protein [Fibrobacteraceae bacterium]